MSILQMLSKKLMGAYIKMSNKYTSLKKYRNESKVCESKMQKRSIELALKDGIKDQNGFYKISELTIE